MPAYRNFSFEELRMQDYAVGRKTASGTGFGTTNAFGAAPAAGPAAGGFGQPSTSTGIFGQPAAATTTNTFGQPSTTTSTFGQPAQPTSGFGGFGQTNTTSTTTGGLFGQPQQQPQPQDLGHRIAFSGFRRREPPRGERHGRTLSSVDHFEI